MAACRAARHSQELRAPLLARAPPVEKPWCTGPNETYPPGPNICRKCHSCFVNTLLVLKSENNIFFPYFLLFFHYFLSTLPIFFVFSLKNSIKIYYFFLFSKKPKINRLFFSVLLTFVSTNYVQTIFLQFFWHLNIWRVSSQNALYPFWSIWDIWDLSCWNIKKIIRKL